MQTNRVLHIGTLIITASALIWLGAEFTRRVEWILPYAFGIGAGILLIGVGIELYKRRRASTK